VDFDFSAEQEALRDSVRRYLSARAPISWVRERYAGDSSYVDDVWRGLAEMGLTAMLAPEAAGGLGLGLVDLGPALEESGRALYPGPLVSSAVGAISAITLLAPDDVLLADLASGAAVGAIALYDEGGRYSWTEPSTTASGDRLTGTKVAVADTSSATHLLVTARTDDGLGLYVVDAAAAGVTIEPTPTFDGSRPLGQVVLQDVPARRIGTDAAAAIPTVLDRLAVATVVDGVGAAEQALQLAVDYAKEREQFGKPIGAFQAVQHLCADMLQLLELGRAGAYYALWALDDAPPEEGHRAATMAKAWASDAFPKIGATAIQVFGGIGFTWEHDIHLFYKRLLSVEQAYGGATDHYEELASLVL
jgi:alkylation response protein AidB-like acyl-CoA dehydrogenase